MEADYGFSEVKPANYPYRLRSTKLQFPSHSPMIQGTPNLLEGGTEEHDKHGGIHYVDTHVCVPEMPYWNAVTNTPCFQPNSEEVELKNININRKYSWNSQRNGFENIYDPHDFYSGNILIDELKKYKDAAVDETVVEKFKRSQTLKKMESAKNLFEATKKARRLSNADFSTPIPHVNLSRLPNRYKIKYPGGRPRPMPMCADNSYC